jgi:hypothetical protein
VGGAGVIEFPVIGRADDIAHETCHFALCKAEAEYRVSLPREDAIVVCSLHVSPVVTWGWSDEDDFPIIEAIAS